MKLIRTGLWASLLAAGLFCGFTLTASSTTVSKAKRPTPVISIIIDDLGKRLDHGRRVINLPGPVACAFLPRAPYTRRLAIAAHARYKEVLLHLPMQSVGFGRLDEGGLTLHMTERAFLRQLEADLKAVPHVQGVNNHMGSLLTRHPGHMMWLMRTLSRHGRLFFVDSRTTRETVALQIANETGVPGVKRDVFLDHDPSAKAVEYQFNRLLRLARKNGYAVAIGHPYPTTLAMLERRLPLLRQHGIRLVQIRTILEINRRRKPSWQASSSPSPSLAKNSKP